MQAANMIEEKKLKKTFILATVVSTLIGTMSGAIALSDKIEEKRRKHKQKKIDGVQDQAIKDINEKLAKIAHGKGRSKSDDSSGSDDEEAKSRLRRRRQQRRDYEDDFGSSTRQSQALIRDAYDDNVRRIGPRYAMGDAITESRLHAQIIALQQTVITVLQDALLNNRNLTELDTQKLLNAQQLARVRTLDALQDQYDRQSSRRQSLLPAAVQPISSSLFCSYSIHLQQTSRPLSNVFAANASLRCPDCDTAVSIDTRDFWIFSTPEGRDFQMDARFVVKCHTSTDTVSADPANRRLFACVLCARFADKDCLCRSVDALVRHIGRAHSADQLACDVDIVELSESVTSSSGSRIRKAITW